MDSEELLEQLADIHLPLEISYWPPAPGWWVLGFLCLLGIVYLIKTYLSRRYLKKICKAALAELDDCYRQFSLANRQDNDEESKVRYINEVNSVLKRVALVHYPHSRVAGLGGRDWVDFIKEKGDSTLLDSETAKALSFGRFQTKCEFNADTLNELGHAWVSSLYFAPKRPLSTSQENTS
tara:strand:+ start:315 stop:854 length:540 start_codon:yes stop_codon:yes gene_type:complete